MNKHIGSDFDSFLREECLLDERPTPTLRVKRLRPEARLPTYATDGAAGLDLYACVADSIYAGETLKFITGIAVEIPPGYEGQIRPRSGLASSGIVAVLGTIDSDYRGEVGVVLHNTRHDRNEYHVKAGDRIAQLVIAPVARAEVVEVEELSTTVRGGGGYGSTGR